MNGFFRNHGFQFCVISGDAINESFGEGFDKEMFPEELQQELQRADQIFREKRA
jgi:hypothetical protein